MRSIREIKFSKFNIGKPALMSRAAVLVLGALVIFGGCGKSNTPAPLSQQTAPAPSRRRLRPLRLPQPRQR